MSTRPPPLEKEPPLPPMFLVVLAVVAAVWLAIAASRPKPPPRADAVDRHAELRAPQWQPGEEVLDVRTGKRFAWPGNR